LVEPASASARSHRAVFFARFSPRASDCAAKWASQRVQASSCAVLEPFPERLALRARHVGRLPPLLLERADLFGDRLGVLECLERLHLFAELLLDPDVRPTLPVGDVAQFLHFRHQRGLRRLEAFHDLVVVLLRRQLRHRPERRADFLQRALARLQRQIGAAGDRLDAADQLLRADQPLAPRLLILFVRRGVARRKRGLRSVVLLGDHRVVDHAGAQIVPFPADRRELLARGGEVVQRRGAAGILRPAPAAGSAGARCPSTRRDASDTRAPRARSAASSSSCKAAVVERGHAFPLGGRDLELVEHPLALQLLDPLAQLDARRAAASRASRAWRSASRAFGLFTRARRPDVRRPRAPACAISAGSGSTTGGMAAAAAAASAASRASFSSAARRSSISRTSARARLDALLFFARAAICSSSPRSVIRSTAASVGSLNSLLRRDAQHGGVVVQLIEGGATHAFVRRVARDRSKGVRIGHPRQRRGGRRLTRGVPGDADQRLGILDRGDGREALALAEPLERFQARCRAASTAPARAPARRRRSCATAPSAPGSISFATAARRTRGSESSRATSTRRSRSSSDISCTNCRRAAASGFLWPDLGAESIEQCHTRSSLAWKPACVRVPGLLALNPKFGQLRDDVAAVRRGADLFVDVQNAAVRSDVNVQRDAYPLGASTP
jgi:hypothetical protein